MQVVDSRPATAALQAIPGMARGHIVQRLADGPTNSTWLAARDSENYVLRLDQPDTALLGLERASEQVLAAAAAAAGLTIPYLYFDAPGGVCLRRYVAGRSLAPAEMREPGTLRELAGLLRRLHGVAANGAPFAPLAAARRYAQQLGTPEARQLAQRAAVLHAGIPPPGRAAALCHNDLVCGNILRVDEDRLLMIDWEYAGMGDPWFDLAVIVEHHGLEAHQARQFLEAYLGCRPPESEIERLARHCAFYACLLELWNLRVRS